MEFVENKSMFYMIQKTPFNLKHNDYQIGDKFNTSFSRNPKRRAYLKAKFKLHRTEREKRILFIEGLHEKVRKSIDKNLPSRQSGIVVFETREQCEALAKKWLRFNIEPLHIYKVNLSGKLHKCSCTPDEKKQNVSKEEHKKGIEVYWRGEEDAGLSEWLFQGKVEIKDIIL